MLPVSIVSWLVAMGWMAFVFLSSVPVMLFIPFERFQLYWPHPLMGWTVRVTFSRVRVHVDPRYRKGVCVFVQNHVSMLDAAISAATIRVPLCGLENASHLRVPAYGWLLRAANAIPVARGQGRYGEIAEACRERASRGISILAFPEGHRTLDGKLRPFRRGAFAIARDAGLPVVPIAVRGAFRMLPKGAITFRPTTLDIYVAPAIETAGLDDEALDVLIDRVATVIDAWVERGERRGDLCVEPIR